MEDLCLAPWVVKEKNYLLGLKLNALRISHLNLPEIPSDKIRYLVDNYFLVESKVFTQPASKIQPVTGPTETGLVNWLWVTADEFLGPALTLKHQLSILNPTQCWEITDNKQTILQYLKTQFLEKPVIIRLSHQEPIGPSVYEALYSDLIEKAHLLWIGETTEGIHMGPLIRSMEDLDDYFKATKMWYFSENLLKAGFTEYWPLSLYVNLVNFSTDVAQAILQCIQASPGTCVLLPDKKEVSLWTTLLKPPVSEADFFKKQFWSKGLIRNFNVVQLPFMSEVNITTCRTPCNHQEYLECNSGKGEDLQKAINTLVGESIERFSAWQSNQCLKRHFRTHLPDTSVIYEIDQFHPFGAQWEQYLAGSEKTLYFSPVRNEINPNQSAYVPTCLIPFPYQPLESECSITRSSTSGLAAHNSYQRAVIKGALELFERQDLYPNFLSQTLGHVLDFSHIPQVLLNDWSNTVRLLKRLQENEIQSWFLIYSPNSTIPIVQCFLHDKKMKLMSRGTGSGYTLQEAVVGSLLESLQIRSQLLKTAKKDLNAAEGSWVHPNVIDQLSHYLNQSYSLPLQDYAGISLCYTDEQLLEELKQTLRLLKKPLLVADLPCPLQGWSAVRVLIPGFTTHQNPSNSAGGRCLLNRVFKYPVPT